MATQTAAQRQAAREEAQQNPDFMQPARPRNANRNIPSRDVDFMDDNPDTSIPALTPEELESTREFMKSNARGIDDVISDDDIPKTVLGASDLENQTIVITSVSFKEAYVQGDKIENAWCDAYSPDAPDNDLRIRCGGYYFVSQMKACVKKNIFPVQGYFMRSQEKGMRNRWEFHSA